MRFLADENMPCAAVQALRQAGLDVASVTEGHAGLADHAVLAWAAREDRVLLTFDTDFGELALQAGLPQQCGIILFRRPMPSPGKAASWIALTIGSRSDWAGHICVVEPGRIRMRPLRPLRPATDNPSELP
ncbi:DUF5615 family PIN-like protein [uncultured Enterovirga sp.]|uniref:DUF5615 family PIN-like protein n=1 Tax=uncultured Enterovirga sp. TaxID=2026352 RepID=UPI0035CB0CE1